MKGGADETRSLKSGSGDILLWQVLLTGDAGRQAIAPSLLSAGFAG